MLNERQQEAVNHIDWPLLILAGAGAGKTHTLTERVAHLVLNVGIAPESILCVTFTNKAAREMRDRIGQKLGIEYSQINLYRESGAPLVGTFHSMGVYFLRLFIDRIGYSKNFVIFDEDDKVRLIKIILAEKQIDEKEVPAKQIVAMISSAKNDGMDPSGMRRIAQSYVSAIAADVYADLELRMRAMNALDFDDILLKVYELLRLPEVLAYFHGRFSYIMVDEYQDTNEIQYQIVTLLASHTKNIAVVGDDWQGIYSWRGANIKNILHFERDYPNATVVKLEQNYRSTKTIIEAANALIKFNRNALEKTLWTDNVQGHKIIEIEAADEKEECREIVARITESLAEGQTYRDWAILYRTNAQSRSIEEALISKNIPYRIFWGVKFYERKEVKDVLSYLRLLHNRSDRIWFSRIINVPSRKIGEKSLEQILDVADDIWADPITAIRHGVDMGIFSGALKTALGNFYLMYESLADTARTRSVMELIEEVLRQVRYREYLELEYGKEDAENRHDNLKELANLASRYDGLVGGEGLAMFLEDIALITDADRDATWEEVVSLMTVHLAKGLEFTNVVISGAEDGLFPHSRTFLEPKELEEERRLMYVAITRAKKRLYITRARERYRFGTYSANPRSKFIKELPPELLESQVIEPKYQFGSGSWNHGAYSHAESLQSDRITGSYDWLWSRTATNSATTASSARARINNTDDFVVWTKVKHPQFWVGTIVAVKGDVADIAFTGGSRGIKRLNIKIAPIDRV